MRKVRRAREKLFELEVATPQHKIFFDPSHLPAALLACSTVFCSSRVPYRVFQCVPAVVNPSFRRFRASFLRGVIETLGICYFIDAFY